MTNREFYVAVMSLENAPAELVEYAQTGIEKLDASNARKAAKAAKAKAEKLNAEAPLYNAVMQMLNSEPITASAVANALEITSSKATVILKSFVKDEIADVCDVKVKGKSGNRVVKGYTLIG